MSSKKFRGLWGGILSLRLGDDPSDSRLVARACAGDTVSKYLSITQDVQKTLSLRRESLALVLQEGGATTFTAGPVQRLTCLPLWHQSVSFCIVQDPHDPLSQNLPKGKICDLCRTLWSDDCYMHPFRQGQHNVAPLLQPRSPTVYSTALPRRMHWDT